MADSIARGQQQPQEDHHTSGDSIPVGFEASHLNHTQDSGVVSVGSSAGPQSQPGTVQMPTMSAMSAMSVFPVPMSHEPPRPDNFCRVPESTFIPVEPAKDPPVSVKTL